MAITANNLSSDPLNSYLTGYIRPAYNWAFVDIQNLYLGIKNRGWKINWSAFREHLYEAHNVTHAIIFLGFIKENNWLYRSLRKAGFHLEFRETMRLHDGSIDGGNIDADLTSFVMDHKTEYAQAVIVADDGDYQRTLVSLQQQGKLRSVISSHILARTSHLLRKVLPAEKFISIHSLRNKVESKSN